MTEWTSLSLTEAQKQRFLEAKDDAGHEGANGAFLVELIEAYESTESADEELSEIAEELKNELSMVNDPGVDADVGELVKRVESLEALVERVPERTAEEFGEKYR